MIIEVLKTIGIGVLTYLAYKVIDLSIDRFKNTKVRLKNTPKNFFQYLQPGSSLAKAREILGQPVHDTEYSMIFKMRDMNIQIWKDGESVETICAVLPKFKLFKRFKIYPLDHKLGSVKIKDVIDEHGEIEYGTSSKSGSAWVHSYFGNPGYYNYYTFGIFDGPSAHYPTNKFPELHVPTSKLSKKTKKLKFNYVSISSKEGQGIAFDFHAMR